MTRNESLSSATLERETRLLCASYTAQVVQEVARLAAGRGGSTREVEGLLWRCELQREPSLRVVVRLKGDSLLPAARSVLRTLGFTVNSMRDVQGDYLAVLI